MNDQNNYLTNIPDIVENYGFCKTLMVRREIIHIKHIFTEIFVRKTINIDFWLERVGLNLFDYMEIMTNIMRKIHRYSREYKNDCNRIVKEDNDRFFPSIELSKGLNNIIVLDFDGVITENNFRELYELCCQRGVVYVCSANPTITEQWFEKHGLTLPNKIHSLKGKVKKMKMLIEYQKTFDNVFYIDNEEEYLKFAWIFGINTYHWSNNKIKYFTLSTK